MSIVSTLILVQQLITRYVLPTILAFGNIGNFLTIGIFSQRKYQTNSCSVYLIFVSIFSLIGVNWAIIPVVYALDHSDPFGSSLILCRIRGYIIHTCSMCFRYTLMLVCADRYFLCNSRISIRSLCRPHIAYRSVCILTIFWMTVSVHLLIWESIEQGRCGVYGNYGQIFGFYVLICTGLIPISFMIIFSILLMKSLRHARSRVQPIDRNTYLNKRNMKLIKLVLVEVMIYIICTVTYPGMTIYMTITNNASANKTDVQKQIESLMNFITMSLLLYLNYNTTFYVHFLTSKSYRNEAKLFLLKFIKKSPEPIQSQQNRLMMTSNLRSARQAQSNATA